MGGKRVEIVLDAVAGTVRGDGASVLEPERFGEEALQTEAVELEPGAVGDRAEQVHVDVVAAMANAATPPRPQKCVCHHIRSHSLSMSRASSPASSGARSCSIRAWMARDPMSLTV